MISDEEKRVLEQAERIRERIRREEMEAEQQEQIVLEEVPMEREEHPVHKRPSAYAQEVMPEVPEEPERVTRRKKRRKKHHFFRNLLIIAAVFFLFLFAAGYFLSFNVEYKPHEKIAEDASWNLPGKYKNGVMNILLIGTDARNVNDDSRSDAMIVVSIVPFKHKIFLTSILRDSYVEIPGIGMNRINHAYQMGKEKLLIETIEQNFHIRIDRYAKVDFFSFIDIIDSMGGVDIELTAAEADYVNGYLAEINTLLGLPVNDQVIPVQDGVQTLNGKQALSFSRIRYIGLDFARTDRQRTVIQALVAKMKKHPLKAVKALKTVLSSLQTDLKKTDIALLTMRAPFLLTYRFESSRIPFDGMWWADLTPSGQDVLGMDFAAITQKLREMLY